MLQRTPEAPGDRRARILDAAERCFVRTGFHRATMQEIATEAGMSPGNLYRYFPSKDAMVEGLAGRDRADIARDFERFAEGEDFLAVFKELGRKHFAEEPRGKAIMCLEIWAEATRNPVFARLTSSFEQDVVERLADLLEAARVAGSVSPEIEPRAIATLISTLANGLFVRKAIVPAFDAASEVPRFLALICGLLEGKISLSLPELAEVPQ